MQKIKYIPKNLIEAVKDIPIQNVLEKIFEDMEYKKDRSGGKFEIYKNDKYIAFVNLIGNDVTIKELATNETWIGGADTIGLVQRAKFWTFFDSESKEKGNYKNEFKQAVLWLANKFNLIKKIKNGKIELDLKEIQVIKIQKEELKEKLLYELELKTEKAKREINYFKSVESENFDKNIRDIDRKLLNLIVEQNSLKLTRNKDKGNRDEL